jgi:hypothetical protein
MDIMGPLMAYGFSLGAGLGGGWWCLRRWTQARHLQDTPTSKIRSAAQGYVELVGLLQPLPDAVIIAPLTGTPCVWWEYRIEQWSGTGKSRSWRILDSGRSEGWLRLADGTGECLINPQGAEVFPSTRKVWKGHQRRPSRGAVSHGASWMLGGEYRYTERRLHAGEPLYAIGEFRTAEHASRQFDAQRDEGAVIREWKEDFAGLLQRFDGNRNGQLDDYEWQRVQLAARVEAHARHRQLLLQPAWHRLHQPAEARPFILSSNGKEELTPRLYWQAALGALVCLVGALATVWMINRQLM